MRDWPRRLAVTAFLLCCGLAAGLTFFAIRPAPGSGREVLVWLERGSGLRHIAAELARQGLIGSEVSFMLLARLPGQGRGLQAGEYLLRDDMNPLDILRRLRAGQVFRHRLTVPEGYTLRQVATLLGGFAWLDERRFLALCRDSATLAALDIDGVSAEGYLFPDTYQLIRGVDDEAAILRRMSTRFQQVWSRLPPPASSLPLDRHQIVILASMVEKETGHGPERPLVAAVFLNRLRHGMRLQSDPTVIYGLEQFDGKLTRAHLGSPSPYNTYTLPALPAGPICNPGQAALAAVLRPTASDALYFVSKNDGTHYFSRSLPEHNQAVRRYQRTEDR